MKVFFFRFKSSVDGIVAHSLHNWLSFDQVRVTVQPPEYTCNADFNHVFSPSVFQAVLGTLAGLVRFYFFGDLFM